MRGLGCKVTQLDLPESTSRGTFVAPTIIEIPNLHVLKGEVFGPVLHVLRHRREELDPLIDGITGTGYGLTFGLHTRLDEMIAHVTGRVRVGNIYINRNMIGAVVGVQPFGGRGLSGTGPKAGGPLYIGRLVRKAPVPSRHGSVHTDRALVDLAVWLENKGLRTEANAAREFAARSALGLERDLAGPVGERNVYALHPRGRVLVIPETERGLYRQVAATLATGNDAAVDVGSGVQHALSELPSTVSARIIPASDWSADGPFSAALIEGEAERVRTIARAIAALSGPLVLVQSATTQELVTDPEAYCLDWLLDEVSMSINTAAAGGNASLMTIGVS
jgi:RHH-type proline utilization regulon transcriptional repressor/proline dehydrogenase/delta 1-pyrroline-5-carboxylate dehydrogenase